ncbi:hypothetical protein N7526_007538 [Penicillium atrosanguineum]|nr:hypothetical protein N7526_007538 [Penicillium atrosanguineum]
MTINRKQLAVGIAFCIIYLFLLFTSRSHSARDPGSFFFKPEAGYRPRYSLKRVEEALQHVSDHSISTSPLQPIGSPAKAARHAEICIGVISVKRPFQQNLDTTLGSILDTLSKDQRSTISLHILFAQTNPADHPDYTQPWLSNLADNVFTYEHLGAPMSSIMRLERNRDVRRKSLFDYRLALKSCYEKTEAPWIMILEDDILAQRDWYEHTTKSLQKIVEWRQQGLIRDWLYLRLFYAEKFLGWNSEEWLKYLTCSILALIVVAGSLLLGRKRYRPVRELTTFPFPIIICFVFLPLLIGLYFMSGRVTMRPLKPGIHVMNRYGCCTQAMIKHRRWWSIFASWGEKKISMAVDTALEKFADENGLDRLAIVPSQMQHVGAASYKEDPKEDWSEPYRVRGPNGVWSMSFEEAYGN